jgi:hypothetical protein
MILADPRLAAVRGRTLRRIGGLAIAVVTACSMAGPPIGPGAAPVDAVVAPPIVVRAPYLYQNRRTQVRVAWKTASSATTVVRWGLTTAVANTITGGSGIYHSVTIKNLKPDTRYYYKVESNGVTLTGARPFRTLASISNPVFRFAVVGDFGAGTVPEQQVADSIRDRHPRLVMTVGDNAYSAGTEDQLDTRVFPQYEDVLDNIAMNAALGNHDVVTDGGKAVKRALGIPAGGYYSFDSSSAHFVVLDTNDPCITAGCAQYDWVGNDLAATHQPFIFVFLHHTFSSCGKHGSDLELRAAYGPVFSAAGVDVVFMGHDHGYQRSLPIDDVLYITTGGGGQGLYTWTTPCPEAAVFHGAQEDPDPYHYLIIDLSTGAAHIRAYRAPDGATLDSVTIAP